MITSDMVRDMIDKTFFHTHSNSAIGVVMRYGKSQGWMRESCCRHCDNVDRVRSTRSGGRRLIVLWESLLFNS